MKKHKAKYALIDGLAGRWAWRIRTEFCYLEGIGVFRTKKLAEADMLAVAERLGIEVGDE